MEQGRNVEPKRKIIDDSKGCQLCITLPSLEDRDRFNEIKEKEKKTNQADTLLMLIDLYNRQSSSDYEVRNMILPMYVYSGNKRTQCRTISFHGDLLYQSGWRGQLILDGITASKYSEDFDFPRRFHDIYVHDRYLNLYFNKDQQRYLVYEYIVVLLREDRCSMLYHEDEVFERPMEVSRCKFVDSFEDAYHHFSRYATTYELNGLRHFLSDSIGKDYDIMDKYFDKIDFIY